MTIGGPTAHGNTFVTGIKNMVVYGSPDGGGSPLAPGLTTSHVNVAWTTDASGYPQTITVGINGYQANAVFKTITLNNKPRLTVRFLGRYTTPG